MISKKVGVSPKNDNYARLAEYIADAGHEGEKNTSQEEILTLAAKYV